MVFKKIKLCYVLTNEFAFNNFLVNHILYLNSTNKYNISVILNSDNQILLKKNYPFVNFIFLNIKRKPNLLSDLSIFIRLLVIFTFNKFDIVHSLMPKTGFLAMSAAYFACIKNRLHTFTGQVWANKSGYKKVILIFFDKLISYFTSITLADSKSQLEYLIVNKVVKSHKAYIVGNGSICGVNVDRFCKDTFNRDFFRKKYSIKSDDVVFLYLGRLNADKGIFDLINAFNLISNFKNFKLFLVGPDEENISEKIQSMNLKNIHFFDYTSEPEFFYNISDILCVPSYREGFGNVIIEASMYSIPTIGSDIYGLQDSIVDNLTGIFFKCGNYHDLSFKMKLLADNSEFRAKLGANAFARSLNLFDSRFIVSKLNDFYITLIK